MRMDCLTTLLTVSLSILPVFCNGAFVASAAGSTGGASVADATAAGESAADAASEPSASALDASSQSTSNADMDNTPEKGSPATPLQGIVEHSSSFSPVSPQLMPGGKFDESSMPKPTPGNFWYPIPDWMAGTWQFKTETVTFMRTFTKAHYPPVPFTLKNEFRRTVGFQKDKSGQIWDYVKAPFSYTAKLNDGLLGYVNENIVEIVRCNDKEIVRKLVGPDSIVDPETQEIKLTNQKECFTRYTQLGEDAVHVDGSTKIFDMNGKPTVLKFSNMMAMRVKPFEVVDEKDGQNLKQMFCDFLKAQGKSDLLP